MDEIKGIMDSLKENGYKSTEQRRAIVESIINGNRYVSAKDILNRVQKQYPGVSFDTIYRNLTILKELELVEETQLDGEAKFKAACIVDHHHHVVCTKCGKTDILPECPLDLLQGMVDNFKVTGHKFEIYGLCKECQ